MNGPRREGWLTLLAGAGAGLAALVLVHLLLAGSYWDYSEGVYALTARLMVHGHGLYSEVVGAQPPGVFLLGAGLLAIRDGLEWLRFGVALLQLVAGVAAGLTVWRLSGSRAASIAATAGVLLTPWAVRQHGALTPEMVALPLLLWAPLIQRVEPLGVVCGLLPLVKVPFVIPALALVLLCRRPGRAAAWAALTLAVGLALSTLLAGGSFWREVVYAQTQSGYRGLGVLPGYWSQAAWNLLGLLVPAALAIAHRAQANDARLLKGSAGLAGALLVTFLTNLKQGTSLTITVPVEAALVPLAACGAVWTLRAATAGPRRDVRARVQAATVVAGLLFVLVQSVSLLASPHHPEPFLRAFSRSAWSVALTRSELDRVTRRVRACPPGLPYGGAPLVAFVAGRSMPDDQPDQFILGHAATLRGVEAQAQRAAARGVCPP